MLFTHREEPMGKEAVGQTCSSSGLPAEVPLCGPLQLFLQVSWLRTLVATKQSRRTFRRPRFTPGWHTRGMQATGLRCPAVSSTLCQSVYKS